MTRYPKAGKGSKWTIKELQNIPVDWKGDSISDGEGLTGEVRVAASGKISVRFKYAMKWEGKLAWYSCGTHPENDIQAIRKNRDEAKELLANGIDPRVQKQATKIENQKQLERLIEEENERNLQNKNFTDLFTVWVKDGVARADGNQELIRMFEKDILPVIGDIPLKKMTENDLRHAYRTILERGTDKNPRERLVLRIAADMRQLFKWADARQPWRSLLENGNPALLVDEKKLISPDYTDERDRILSPKEIKQLHDLILNGELAYANAANKRIANKPFSIPSQCAIWICLSTICRIGELLMARWEHVNFKDRIWFIPRENVKGIRGKKQDHHVYLSDFALYYFIKLQAETGQSEWCFPSRNSDSHINVKAISKSIGDRQSKFKDHTAPLKNRRSDNSLVVGDREWTPHDLRRTGATMMQELKVDLNIIDRCQNHIIAGSKVRRHYLKYDYAEEKQQAWEALGQRLEEINPTK